jgi:hypothetical protein
MKNFFGFDPSNPHITPKRIAHATVANLLAVIWAAVVVYLAFTDPFNAGVCFIAFVFSYLMGKYSQ